MIKKLSVFTMIASAVVIFISIWGTITEMVDSRKIIFGTWFVIPIVLTLIAGWVVFRPLSVNKNIYQTIGGLILFVLSIGFMTYFVDGRDRLILVWLVRVLSYTFLFIGALSVYIKSLTE